MLKYSARNSARQPFPLRIRTCQSGNGCKYSCDSGDPIKKRILTAFSHLHFPAKIKLSISGCIRCCTSPKLCDIGMIATPKGWEVHFGGNSCYHPKIAVQTATGLTEDQAFTVVNTLISIYCAHGRAGQRTSSFLNSFGDDNLLHAVADSRS